MASDTLNHPNHNHNDDRIRSHGVPSRPRPTQAEMSRNLPSEDSQSFNGRNYWEEQKATIKELVKEGEFVHVAQDENVSVTTDRKYDKMFRWLRHKDMNKGTFLCIADV